MRITGRRVLLVMLTVAACARFGPDALGAEGASRAKVSFDACRASVGRACREFSGYDRDRDGHNEIESLVRPEGEGRLRFDAHGRAAGTVLVLVEERLWRKPTIDAANLHQALSTYVGDLGRQGSNAFTVVSSLYAGPMHQDGLTTLALRDFLQAVYRRVPDLQAVVLVGNYPSGFLVRQYYWKRGDGITLHAGTKAEEKWDAVSHVRSIAEPVAKPFDLPLADLDGHWDLLYHRGPERLASLIAAFPEDKKGEETTHFEYGQYRYEDFFLVQDGTWEEQDLGRGSKRFMFPGEPNVECTESDRGQVNVLARPEIAIGRINAYHAAYDPNPAIKGIHGEGLLDASGRPQTVEFADARSVPKASQMWFASEKLERRLLLEFFERDHRYRSGGYKGDLPPASFSSEWDSSVPEMIKSVPAWAACDRAGAERVGSKVTITDFVEWMKRPALARAVKGHANSQCTVFAPPPDEPAYEKLVGPQIWCWAVQGSKLVPTLSANGGLVTFGLMRSLYENRSLPDCPNLYFHTGCESILPAGYESRPYTSPEYGFLQGAESILFYGNGLSLVGRGKVFYDEPREFWKVLGQGGTWGDAWKHYFDVEGQDAELAKDGIGRKRAYFWSIIGDPMVTLPAPQLKASRR